MIGVPIWQQSILNGVTFSHVYYPGAVSTAAGLFVNWIIRRWYLYSYLNC